MSTSKRISEDNMDFLKTKKHTHDFLSKMTQNNYKYGGVVLLAERTINTTWWCSILKGENTGSILVV